jgi:exodeoxyribonuclease VII small subunit
LAKNFGKSADPQDGQSACFEDALTQLEAIVHRLEEGQIGLAEALSEYEQGIKLLRQCYALLESTERRIEVLSGVTADGTEVTQAWDDAALSLEEKAQSRSRRRSAKPSPAAPPDTNGDAEGPEAGGRLF